jgi:hypothetical protein
LLRSRARICHDRQKDRGHTPEGASRFLRSVGINIPIQKTIIFIFTAVGNSTHHHHSFYMLKDEAVPVSSDSFPFVGFEVFTDSPCYYIKLRRGYAQIRISKIITWIPRKSSH